ncbi:unannotated protein [freshwater metagenome]|uniref:Unannotated protein n=1 Tax=freshwater metagenome TaxID=449393 RepID=A0A6J7GYF3_9ZZZZ
MDGVSLYPAKMSETTKFFNQPDSAYVAQRLRSIRRARKWTLQDVERESKGAIKAIVLGSYERGDRSVSVKKAIELATFYDLPVTQLFQDVPSANEESLTEVLLVIDLRSAARLAPTVAANYALISYLKAITQRRMDWNGEILSLRKSDLSNIALIVGMSDEETLRWLQNNRLLITSD